MTCSRPNTNGAERRSIPPTASASAPPARSASAMDLVASPFHPGERTMQARAGVRERMDARGGKAIRDLLPEQHRSFFALLPFLPAAFETADGWPAATILAGPPGFVSSPDPRTLRVGALPDEATAPRLEAGAPVGLLGIDLGRGAATE
ncbi:MAG: hypothetical protein M3Y41_12900 [Pseudomonadota bacterium]|nr:hypothetical protein [Pseudomonadota bacterium]